MRARLGIDLPHRRALLLDRETILRRVAIRAYADIKLGAVAVRDETLRPMMVDGAARQNGHPGGRIANLRLPGVVGKTHQRIGIRYVKAIADERHADGRVQPLQEDMPLRRLSSPGRTRTAHIAQQRDAIRARGASRPSLLHDVLVYRSAETLRV